METVSVNRATSSQLIVLLGLSSDEAARVIAARPFPTAEALTKALPTRLASSGVDLDIPLLDINVQSADDLVKNADITQEVADKVCEGRPYFMMHQLLLAIGDRDYQRLRPFYSTPAFAFTDKLTRQNISLDPDSSQVMVSKVDRPAEASLPSTFAAEHLYGAGASKTYDVYALPESEAATNVIADIEKSYGKRTIPAFVDQHSVRRYFNPRYCVVQFQKGVTARAAWAIMAELGLKLEDCHRTPGLYTLRIPEAERKPSAMTTALNGLNARDEVKFAEPNYLGFDDRDGTLFSNVSSAQVPWNLTLSRIPEAWTTTTGSPDVVIAVIDTGVDQSHPALKDAFVPRAVGETFNFRSQDDPEPSDEDGHGSFIAGLLVGNGQTGVMGICPRCRILALKVSVTGDTNSYATRRDAILFAAGRIVPPQRLIINMSWKTTGDIGLIRDACDIAAAQGALLVASAGNMPDRENEPHYPSDYPCVVSVAAVAPDRRRADYSYFGDAVDVSAPGGDESAPERSITSAAPGGRSATGCGTSFAAPHVAGIAALAAAACPNLLAAQLRFCVESGASPLSDPGMGKGLCDAKGAIDLAVGTPGSISGKLATMIGNASTLVTVTNSRVLDDLNGLDIDALASRYGLARLTAEIIASRRPLTAIAQIHDTLGLSDDKFAALVYKLNK
jgi:subtilisin family serine protease